jgi:hypothetical protein
MGLDIGDVCHPSLIGLSCIKLLLQLIRGHNCGRTTIAAGPATVADLCFDVR